jgi:hypothetical protein
MLGLASVLMWLARRRPVLAGSIALLSVAADLAIANSRYVLTVPQSVMNSDSRVVQLIKDAERDNPSPGPYRIHRMPQWHPGFWFNHESTDRVSDFVTWERETIQPKYGINLGVEYTHTIGVAELYDYEWFFGGFPYSVKGEYAQVLGITPGQKVVYFPRRSFDMWNSRYFVLPEFPNGWLDEHRGYAAFLWDTEMIYPPPDRLDTPEKQEARKTWIETHDFQIRRNLKVFPRAWVVHDALALAPMEGRTRIERSRPMQDMLYADDPIWHDPTLSARDPHRFVWLENDQRIALRDYLDGTLARPTETVKVSYPNPQRVELDVSLETPGIVVLADIYYPGWKLTINGEPAPVYRVNHLMRGAAVKKGKYKLVYTFEPRSFEVGKAVTLVGLAVSILFAGLCVLRPRFLPPQAESPFNVIAVES